MLVCALLCRREVLLCDLWPDGVVDAGDAEAVLFLALGGEFGQAADDRAAVRPDQRRALLAAEERRLLLHKVVPIDGHDRLERAVDRRQRYHQHLGEVLGLRVLVVGRAGDV